VRFGYTQEANCTYCYEPKQTIKHLYTECGRTQILFKNFEKHYKLDTELTWCKKIIGIYTNVPRQKATHKKLGILRKLIYSCNHDGRVPRKGDMLVDVDRQYVTSTASRKNKAESSQFSTTGIFKGKETTTMEKEADKMGC
jgi:hypothetical protein